MPLTDQHISVLQALASGDRIDGYALHEATGLDAAEINAIAESLIEKGLVEAEGWPNAGIHTSYDFLSLRITSEGLTRV